MLTWTGNKDNQKAFNGDFLLFLANGIWKLMDPYYKQWSHHDSEQAAKLEAEKLYNAFEGF